MTKSYAHLLDVLGQCYDTHYDNMIPLTRLTTLIVHK